MTDNTKIYLGPNEQNPVKQNAVTRQLIEILDHGSLIMSNNGTGNPGTPNYENNEVPDLISITYGSSVVPITDIQPTVGISLQEAVNLIDTTGGQNAALYISAHGYNTSDATHNAQVNGLVAKVYQSSTGSGDLCAGYFVAEQRGLNSGGSGGQNAYGVFTFCDALSTAAGAIGAEFQVKNDSGFDTDSNAGFNSRLMTGVDIIADGANQCSQAIFIRGSFATTGTGFDSGILFASGVFNQHINIRWQCANIMKITTTTTYTNGIDFSNGTFASFAFKSPKFSVDGSGNIIATSLASTYVTVASLPSAGSNPGLRYFVTNATSQAAFGTTITTGGANQIAAPVYSDGTNWRFG